MRMQFFDGFLDFTSGLGNFCRFLTVNKLAFVGDKPTLHILVLDALDRLNLVVAISVRRRWVDLAVLLFAQCGFDDC